MNTTPFVLKVRGFSGSEFQILTLKATSKVKEATAAIASETKLEPQEVRLIFGNKEFNEEQ